MKILRNEQGFTLIEALVAMVILTIGILALFTMQSTAVKGNATASRITQASTWGADRMEQLFAEDFDNDDVLRDIDMDSLGGLSDAQCCQDGNDPAGNAVAVCVKKADSCFEEDGYFIYVNIAEDQPLTFAPDTSKTIRVIVNKSIAGKVVNAVTFDYFRTIDI